jgi:hypothetical protein
MRVGGAVLVLPMMKRRKELGREGLVAAELLRRLAK